MKQHLKRSRHDSSNDSADKVSTHDGRLFKQLFPRVSYWKRKDSGFIPLMSCEQRHRSWDCQVMMTGATKVTFYLWWLARPCDLLPMMTGATKRPPINDDQRDHATSYQWWLARPSDLLRLLSMMTKRPCDFLSTMTGAAMRPPSDFLEYMTVNNGVHLVSRVHDHQSSSVYIIYVTTYNASFNFNFNYSWDCNELSYTLCGPQPQSLGHFH